MIRFALATAILVAMPSSPLAAQVQDTTKVVIQITSSDPQTPHVSFRFNPSGTAVARGTAQAYTVSGSGENQVIEVVTPATFRVERASAFSIDLTALDGTHDLMVSLSGASWEDPKAVFAAGRDVRIRRADGSSPVQVIAGSIWRSRD